MNFPHHECGLYLTHNANRDVYQTVKEWLDSIDHLCDPEVWGSEEAMQRAIDTNEMWELQWYPYTPVGFCVICAPTFDELVARLPR